MQIIFKSELIEKWKSFLLKIDYAFQPIVNPITGTLFGAEALLRNTEKFGYDSIYDLLDEVYEEGELFYLDYELRRRALKKFQELEFYKKIKLFYNIDSRLLEMPEFQNEGFDEITAEFKLEKNQVCFEFNGRKEVKSKDSFINSINSIKKNGIKIAIDNYSSKNSSYEMFYTSSPDYLKVDRFLISGINKDIKKKSFCSHLVTYCKTQGILIIAEGIETLEEFYICKDLGFDLVQGYFILKPELSTKKIHQKFPYIQSLEKNNKRKNNIDQELIAKEIIKLDTMSISDPVTDLFEKFKNNLDYNFFPVLDENEFPLGIIHEKTIRNYVYSPLGKDLLQNKSFFSSLSDFVTKSPAVEINTSQSIILEVFINNPESEGVIITENFKYAGFLTAKSLLSVINDKNLSYAREVNPLTKLPGNILINKYINQTIGNTEEFRYYVYYDFDNFKPFNDRFGFRLGDRAIILFAELIQKSELFKKGFIGHVGGDDFFSGIVSASDISEKIENEMNRIIQKFSDDVTGFYPAEDIERGFYQSTDRNGEKVIFNFLSVSIAMISMSPGKVSISNDELTELLAQLKKEGKSSNKKYAIYKV